MAECHDNLTWMGEVWPGSESVRETSDKLMDVGLEWEQQTADDAVHLPEGQLVGFG